MNFKNNSRVMKLQSNIYVRKRVHILSCNNNNLEFYDQQNLYKFSKCIADSGSYISNIE